MQTSTNYYRLEDQQSNHIGDFSEYDIREAVEKIASGKAWGWRPCPDGSMDAVCDGVTIATAHVIDN